MPLNFFLCGQNDNFLLKEIFRYVCVYTCIYVCIYAYIWCVRERERKGRRKGGKERLLFICPLVDF